jgi:hypothetical protein
LAFLKGVCYNGKEENTYGMGGTLMGYIVYLKGTHRRWRVNAGSRESAIFHVSSEKRIPEYRLTAKMDKATKQEIKTAKRTGLGHVYFAFNPEATRSYNYEIDILREKRPKKSEVLNEFNFWKHEYSATKDKTAMYRMFGQLRAYQDYLNKTGYKVKVPSIRTHPYW